MIGYLSGTLQHQDQTGIVILTHGVGYKVFPSSRALDRQVHVGEHIELYVHTHVREDQLSLYGFLTTEELELFELLLSVSGVGPKSALAILSVGSPQEIKSSVSRADVQFFQSVKGIGKKSAQKIIIDLKGKFGDLKELDLSDADKKAHKDVISALTSMGLTTAETKEALKHIDDSLALEEQIRQALKHV